jgi:hypothetical protein
VSNVFFVLAAVGGGVGITALAIDLATGDDTESHASITPTLGVGFVGMKGSF